MTPVFDPKRAMPSRRYYGWVIAATLAVTETVSWGVLFYAFSVFLLPMQADLGWSSATLTGGYSVGLLVSGVAAPFVGRWLDRHGPRALMTAGSILGALMVAAWAGVHDVLLYYAVWAGLGLAMAATLYEPAFVTLAHWFERDRARAVLLVTVAAGFASTIFLPLSAWLVERLEWRPALLVLAGLLGVLTIGPHAVLLRRRPADLGLLPDGAPQRPAAQDDLRPTVTGDPLRVAIREAAFWWLAFAFFLETLAAVAVGVTLIPYLIERGDGAAFAAGATGLVGAAQVGSRVLATVFGGRLSQIALTAIVFALQAVALVVLLEWQERAGVLVAVLLLGAGRGVVTLMRAGITAALYGRAHYGSINGMLAFILTCARALGPVGAGTAYVILGAYEPLLWTLAAVCVVGAAAMAGVRRPPQRRGSPV